MRSDRQRGAVVGVVVPFGRYSDIPADEMAGMVYEGDLHALIESRAKSAVEAGSAKASDKGVLERLRDAVWPFIR
jgi:hypothetical protein